ncbi:MAG: chemotaxis protein CheW [Steroidobacteraceae bacterium]
MNAITTDAGATTVTTADQYLTFQLAGQDYGVPILSVQEIKGWDKPTRLPHSAEYVQGVINLRGAVVPIIDLRRRFGLGEIEYSPTTVVIVVRVSGKRGGLTAGIVVDAVCGVGNVSADNLRPVPEVGSTIDAHFISGIATVDERMLILLSIDRLVTDCLADPLATDKVA